MAHCLKYRVLGICICIRDPTMYTYYTKSIYIYIYICITYDIYVNVYIYISIYLYMCTYVIFVMAFP